MHLAKQTHCTRVSAMFNWSLPFVIVDAGTLQNLFLTLPSSLFFRWWPYLTSSPPQGSSMAKQISAPYIECSAQQSENSVRDIFHVATLACINKNNKNVKRSKAARTNKRISHMPSRPDLAAVASDLRKDKAKSCSVMWLIRLKGIRLRRMRTEHSASRKLWGNALSCMQKTPYLSGKGFYKLQFMYMLLEYSAPTKKHCIVASPSMWPPPHQMRKLSVSGLPARGSDPLPLGGRSGCGRGFPHLQEMSRRSDVIRRRSFVTEEHVIFWMRAKGGDGGKRGAAVVCAGSKTYCLEGLYNNSSLWFGSV